MATWEPTTHCIGGVIAQEIAKVCDVAYEVPEPAQPSTIRLNAGTDEMLRITADGFWVRGVRVEQNSKEAEVVYNAFKQWLAWANLQR